MGARTTADQGEEMTTDADKLTAALLAIAKRESELDCVLPEDHWIPDDQPGELWTGHGEDVGQCQCAPEIQELYLLRLIPVKVWKGAGCSCGCYERCVYAAEVSKS
jgi:hypothetical protein